MSCESVAKRAIDAAKDAGLLYAVPPTERNPRGIDVHHRGPGPHLDCPANIILTCAAHRGGVAFCWIPKAESDADKRGQWICDPCLSDLVDLLP